MSPFYILHHSRERPPYVVTGGRDGHFSFGLYTFTRCSGSWSPTAFSSRIILKDCGVCDREVGSCRIWRLVGVVPGAGRRGGGLPSVRVVLPPE